MNAVNCAFKPMNQRLQSTDSQYLLASVPYTQGNRPDENEIRKVIRAYEDRNWVLVQRSENAQITEDCTFSLLQFRLAMQ